MTTTVPNPFDAAMDRLLSGGDLSQETAYAVFSELMDGKVGDVEIGALLTALRTKGESADELVGAARAMQERATPIVTRHTGLLDTCGTGGDQLHTFNISTATALVVAACGVPVPKHGNRGVSSKSGSADVLEQLGVNINLSPTAVSQCLDQLKIGFCFAPLLHGAMKHAAPVRKRLKFRTIFNFLGPLTNPARAEYQLVGTGRVQTAEKLARALSQLGRKRALVVCGADQLDEVSLWGKTTVFDVRGEHVAIKEWTASDFGLSECRVEEVQIESAAESASLIREVYAGKPGAARDLILANTAAALLVSEREADLRQGMATAAAAIDSGAVRRLLDELGKLSNALAASGSSA
jgi:anthranilate phosphoribosyltransferase